MMQARASLSPDSSEYHPDSDREVDDTLDEPPTVPGLGSHG